MVIESISQLSWQNRAHLGLLHAIFLLSFLASLWSQAVPIFPKQAGNLEQKHFLPFGGTGHEKAAHRLSTIPG
jgi:hypothetical protein